MSNNNIKKQHMFTNEHYGKWVALSADRKAILGYSNDLSSLCSKLGTKDVVYTKPLNPSLQHAF